MGVLRGLAEVFAPSEQLPLPSAIQDRKQIVCNGLICCGCYYCILLTIPQDCCQSMSRSPFCCPPSVIDSEIYMHSGQPMLASPYAGSSSSISQALISSC